MIENFTENDLVNIYNIITLRQSQFSVDVDSINRLENLKNKTRNLLYLISDSEKYELTEYGNLISKE